ncbi:MAG TPA: hypothetical protein PLZ79_09095 [Burkholderiales bacterium]|nr:hypothetical protein [Burkholderiaceae bacterium]HQR53416.1 hypothetical protein [Burkholderiales bacterium]
MTAADERLESLKAKWRAVARYRVFRSGWYPERKKLILATSLTYEEAQRRAAEEYELLRKTDPRVRGRFADDTIEVELENTAMLDRMRGTL